MMPNPSYVVTGNVDNVFKAMILTTSNIKKNIITMTLYKQHLLLILCVDAPLVDVPVDCSTCVATHTFPAAYTARAKK